MVAMMPIPHLVIKLTARAARLVEAVEFIPGTSLPTMCPFGLLFVFDDSTGRPFVSAAMIARSWP